MKYFFIPTGPFMQRAFIGSLAATLQTVAKEMEGLAFAGVCSRASNTGICVQGTARE